jgi:2-[(L-alanin-3-ylcarbamoyl)methyl]-2-hydroxybutanedioate decarboxylase
VVTTPQPLVELIRDRAGGTRSVCLYAYDLDALEAHASRVVATLPERYRMFYAMKANGHPRILATLARHVAGFEVASGGEVAKARAVGEHIPVIFGGPGKTEEEITDALALGVTRFHVESTLELRRVSAVAGRLGRLAEVLLRVNLTGPFPSATLVMAGRPTQFGIGEESLPGAITLAKDLPHLRVAGFHLHSVSNVLDADAHLQLLDHYRRMVIGWEDAFGISCEILNFGGGIGVNYADVADQFDWDRFTGGLAQLAADAFPPHWREIQFECGRYLTAHCGFYAVEVLDIKRNHGMDYLVVRGGNHHFRLPSSWRHNHPFEVVPVDRWPLGGDRPELRSGRATVVGELCTPKDVLATDVTPGRVRAGDVLVFVLAGAYGWEISHHDFLSHPHPDQLFLDSAQHSSRHGSNSGPRPPRR